MANQPKEIASNLEADRFEEIDVSGNIFEEQDHCKEFTVDQILEHIGQCGAQQIRIIIMMSLILLPHAYQIMLIYFVNYSPPWKCVHGNFTKMCNITGTVTVANTNLYKKRCSMDTNAWEYNIERKYSFVTEFDLICDETPYASFAKASFYIGWGIGCVPLGASADYFGRKPVLFSSLLMMLLVTFLLAFVTAYWQFILLRLLSGFFLTGAVLSGYVIVTEIVGPAWRPLVTVIVFTTGTLGYFILALKAYLLENWRTLSIVCSAPYLILLGFWWSTPESLRWLVSKGKVSEAKKILYRIAYHNGKHMPKGMLIASTSVVCSGSFIDCFKKKVLLKRTVLLGFAWFVAAHTYYGISLAASDLSGDFYTDFVLIALAEIPASLIFLLVVDRLGRKYCTSISLLFAGGASLLVAAFPEQSNKKVLKNLRVASGMFAKFFNNLSFHGCYLWTIEMFPTIVRTQSISFSSSVARLGAVLAPFVVDNLRIIYSSLPFICIGFIAIAAGITSCFLPETKNMPTIETFEDAESFLKDGKYRDTTGRQKILRDIGENMVEESYDDEWPKSGEEELLLTTNL